MTDEVRLVDVPEQVQQKDDLIRALMSSQTQLAEAKKQIAELETQLKVVRDSYAKADEELETGRKAHAKLEKEVKRLHGIENELQEEQQNSVNLQHTIDARDERIEKLKEINEALYAESVKQQNRCVIAERSRQDMTEQLDYLQKMRQGKNRLRAEYDEAYRIMREAAFLDGGVLSVERILEIEPEVKEHVKSFRELVLRANEFGLVLKNEDESEDDDWDVAFAGGYELGVKKREQDEKGEG